MGSSVIEYSDHPSPESGADRPLPAATHGPWTAWVWARAAALFLLVITPYLPAFHAGFIWDDDSYITDNPMLHSRSGLVKIWLQPGAVPQYYPFTFTTFWIDYHLWGLHPAGYHAVNILLHALATILLWLVLRYLSVPGAWLAAAIFAVHPVQVESVAWATERKNLLSGVFYTAALLAAFRCFPLSAGPPVVRSRWAWYALTLVFYVAALLSKTVACSMPAVLLLLLWWKRGAVRWREVLALLPFFVIGLSLASITSWTETHYVGARGPEWDLSPLDRCLIAGRALCFYAGKLLWPADLIFMYPRWQIDPGQWSQYAFPIAVLALLATFWLLRNRLGRAPLVALLCFAGMLLPALGFFNVYPMRYSFVADHFQYLASAAFIAATTAMLVRVCARRHFLPWSRPAAAGAVLALLIVLSWQRCQAFANAQTLWLDTLEKNPDSWMAHNNFGSLLAEQGKPEEALKHLEEAVRLKPDHWGARSNLGSVLAKLGRLPEAAAQYRTALALAPDEPNIHNDLGTVLFRLGRLPEAARQYEAAIRLDPARWQAHYNLGVIREQERKFDQAASEFAQALQLEPSSAKAWHHLGRLAARQGKFDRAMSCYRQAVLLDPASASFRFSLAVELDRHGLMNQAEAQCQEARRLDPSWPAAAQETAWDLATNPDSNLRRGTFATFLAGILCAATQNQIAPYLDTLAVAQAEAGNFSRAADTARQALELSSRQSVDAHAIQARLALYEKHLPYREPVRLSDQSKP